MYPGMYCQTAARTLELVVKGWLVGWFGKKKTTGRVECASSGRKEGGSAQSTVQGQAFSSGLTSMTSAVLHSSTAAKRAGIRARQSSVVARDFRGKHGKCQQGAGWKWQNEASIFVLQNHENRDMRSHFLRMVHRSGGLHLQRHPKEEELP